MRTLNLKKISTLLYGKCSDERKTLFESYSKSVNAGYSGPYHIINTNVVLAFSKKAKFRGRSGDNFIMIPEYETAGIGIAGLPVVVPRYNGYIAWGMTIVMADNQDIYLEKLKPVTRIFHETVHSMIMNEILQKDRIHDLMPFPVKFPFEIALKWAAFEQDETLAAFLSLGRSKSVSEAESAAKKIRTISLIFMAR